IDRVGATARSVELERLTGVMFDRETMVSLGRQAGARALIYGRVSSYEYSVEKKPWQDTQGKQHIEEIGRGHVSVFIQIAEVETGQVLDAFTYDKNVQASRGGLGLFGIITRDNIEKNTLLSTARKAIANDFIRRVVPYFENVPIRLYVNKDFPQLSQGNAKASLGNWNDAKDLYNASLGRMTGQLAENRYMALYNRAVAEKYLNEFDAAKKSFEEAYGLTRDANIKTQLEMVEERRKAYERLNKKAASASNPS
ncbi:MAG: CsgG/HfaB family protein, partial [Planctomycetota bacterium]